MIFRVANACRYHYVFGTGECGCTLLFFYMYTSCESAKHLLECFLLLIALLLLALFDLGKLVRYGLIPGHHLQGGN